MKQAFTDPWAQRLRALAPLAWAVVALIATYLWSRVVRERIADRAQHAPRPHPERVDEPVPL